VVCDKLAGGERLTLRHWIPIMSFSSQSSFSIFLFYGCANPAFNGRKNAVHEATEIRASLRRALESQLRTIALRPFDVYIDSAERLILTWGFYLDSQKQISPRSVPSTPDDER
jgi:hypothetical protein